jgi:hypothetical protein
MITTDVELDAEAGWASVDRCLSKPFPIRDLLAAVSTLLPSNAVARCDEVCYSLCSGWHRPAFVRADGYECFRLVVEEDSLNGITARSCCTAASSRPVSPSPF